MYSTSDLWGALFAQPKTSESWLTHPGLLRYKGGKEVPPSEQELEQGSLLATFVWGGLVVDRNSVQQKIIYMANFQSGLEQNPTPSLWLLLKKILVF